MKVEFSHFNYLVMMNYLQYWCQVIKITETEIFQMLADTQSTSGVDRQCEQGSIYHSFKDYNFAFRVVSIGVNHTFKVIFTPLEYIPTMSKTLHFFGSRFLLCTPTSSLFVLYFSNKKRVRYKLTLPFSLCRTA